MIYGFPINKHFLQSEGKEHKSIWPISLSRWSLFEQVAWTVIWERVWLGLSTTEEVDVCRYYRGLDELLADTTCQPGNHKCFPLKELKAFSGFVSNRNNSMMTCRLWCALCLNIALVCSLHIAAAWHGTHVYDESQISKLSRRSGPNWGQPNNREFNEPSAPRRMQFYSMMTNFTRSDPKWLVENKFVSWIGRNLFLSKVVRPRFKGACSIIWIVLWWRCLILAKQDNLVGRAPRLLYWTGRAGPPAGSGPAGPWS